NNLSYKITKKFIYERIETLEKIEKFSVVYGQKRIRFEHINPDDSGVMKVKEFSVHSRYLEKAIGKNLFLKYLEFHSDLTKQIHKNIYDDCVSPIVLVNLNF